MLKITVPATEYFDEESSQFVTTPEVELKLEHSLVSLSKWESVWEKPFLSQDKKTSAETLDYVRCMTLNEEEVPDEVYAFLGDQNVKRITEYIKAKMSATWFSDDKKKPGVSEIITSELVYYWMISLNIPLECERWHLNRLFTLIQIFNRKNAPAKKMSKSEIAARNRALNAQRRAQLNSRG